MDTFTSLLAGCTIFAILGSLAEGLGVKVTEVVRSGPGLAFGKLKTYLHYIAAGSPKRQ